MFYIYHHAAINNHSSSGHHSYELYTTTTDVIEPSEQPNVNSSAPSRLLTDNPLYGEQQPESTMDVKSPDSTNSVLHELDNPLYGPGSGENSDPMAAIYSEPNPAYVQSPQRSVKDGELEPYAYARMNTSDTSDKVEDSSPHYEYASTSK